MKSVLLVVMTILILVGLLSGQEFLGNVAIGLAWFTTIAGLVVYPMAFGESSSAYSMRKVFADCPRWRRLSSPIADFLIAIVLAGNAQWLLFALWSVRSVLQATAWTHSKACAEAADAPTPPDDYKSHIPEEFRHGHCAAPPYISEIDGRLKLRFQSWDTSEPGEPELLWESREYDVLREIDPQ